MQNAINWFPVADIDRAPRFYEAMLARKLRRENLDCMPGVDEALARVGFFAHVRDTEGNAVALHATA